MTYIDVTDNGSGLDLPRDEAKVFGMFQRAHAEPAGQGVALYTIRRFMERVGGRIDVRQADGGGQRCPPMAEGWKARQFVS